MDFAAIRDALKRNGYSDDTADARIAHGKWLELDRQCIPMDTMDTMGAIAIL